MGVPRESCAHTLGKKLYAKRMPNDGWAGAKGFAKRIGANFSMTFPAAKKAHVLKGYAPA
jgi:hypothetical protein